MAAGKHPFPFRTRQLSPPAPMVLGGRPPGRVGRRRDFFDEGPCICRGLRRVRGELPGAVHSTGGSEAFAPSWSRPQSSYGTAWTTRRASNGHRQCVARNWRGIRAPRCPVLGSPSRRKRFVRVGRLILLPRESEQRDFRRSQSRRSRWRQFQSLPVRLSRAVGGMVREEQIQRAAPGG